MKDSLDFVQDAIKRYIQEGDRGISWVYHHCMSKQDGENFDTMLVKTKDILSETAGTTENRFYIYVKRTMKG